MKFVFASLLLGASISYAQVPAPQVLVSGTIGAAGNFPTLNSGSFAIPADSDYTVLYPNVSCIVCKITSSVSLTATRNLIEPAAAMTFNITNATNGGQSIVVKPASGTGVTIANGTSKWIWFNGTNYVEIDPPGTGAAFITSLTTAGTSGPATAIGGVLNIPQYSGGGSMTWPAAAGIPNYTGSSAWGTSYGASNQIPGNFLTLFGPSGSSHAPGAVPDPGSSAGTAHYLREDGTWAVPPGGGSGCTLPGIAHGLLFDSGSSTCTATANLATDSLGTGNLFSTGLISNSPTNAPVESGLITAHSTNMLEYRNYGQVLSQYGGSILPTIELENQSATYWGIGLLPSPESANTSTQLTNNQTYGSRSQGQNIENTSHGLCLSTGDCITREDYLSSLGGSGQQSHEGTHGHLEQIGSGGNASHEVCPGGGGGCFAGSVAMEIDMAVGQGMLLYDLTQAAAINITGFVAPTTGQPFGEFTATGISLGTSIFFQTATAVAPPSPNPGTNINYVPPAVTLAINTSPTYTAAATSTSGIAASGYACMMDPPGSPGYEFYERVAYTKVDATHISINPWWPHATNALLSVGGACGYGAEQHATSTAASASVVFPIVASLDATHFLYAGGNEGYQVGSSGQHNYENASCTPTQVSRSLVGATWTNFVTAGSCTGLTSGSLNQVRGSVSGITVSSGFNETNVLFTAVVAIANEYSYTSTTSGAVSPTSVSAGTVTAGDTTGSIYPVALVTNPVDAGNSYQADGIISTTPWAALSATDVVAFSLPYYSYFTGTSEVVEPTEDQLVSPQAYQAVLSGGASRLGNSGIGAGFYAENTGAYTQYKFFGGTYMPPTAAYFASGLFQNDVYTEAPSNAVVLINDGTLSTYPGLGCFGYDLFQSTNSSPRISMQNCSAPTGDAQAQSLSISAHDVNLGYFSGGTTVGIQIFNDAANGTKIAENLPTTINSPISGTALTLTPLSGSKALVASGEADFNSTVYGAGLASGTPSNCIGRDGSNQLIVGTCPGGGISGQTTGYLPLAGSATTLTAPSNIDDGVTTAGTLTAHEPIAITGSTHGITIPAGTAVSGAAGKVVYTSDATNGYAEVNENNTGPARVCTVSNGVCAAGVADTTTTVGTTAVSANSCSTAATVTMTGLTTSMTAQFTPTTDVSGVAGWGPATPGLYISAWPSASNTLSYKVCNSSGSSITPGSSVTFNVSAR